MRLRSITVAVTAGTSTFATLLIAAGCAARGNQGAPPAGARPAVATEAAGKSGAQLWADNCKRCHNLRGPETYTPAQWEVAVHHMRLRANLTGEETRKVTAFLKSAS